MITEVGIYRIFNIKTNKEYIGSSLNCKYRQLQHFQALKYRRHKNKILQEDYNKYGEESFRYEFIKHLKEDDFLYYEQIYINKSENCYNIKKIATRKKITRTTKEKISKTLKGRSMSKDVKEKISKTLKGRKPSLKSIELLRKRNKLQKGIKKGLQEKTIEKYKNFLNEWFVLYKNGYSIRKISLQFKVKPKTIKTLLGIYFIDTTGEKLTFRTIIKNRKVKVLNSLQELLIIGTLKEVADYFHKVTTTIVYHIKNNKPLKGCNIFYVS